MIIATTYVNGILNIIVRQNQEGEQDFEEIVIFEAEAGVIRSGGQTIARIGQRDPIEVIESSFNEATSRYDFV